MRTILVVAAVLAATGTGRAAGSVAADREALGLAMFRVGRFAEAEQAWTAAAAVGNGRAARFLGVMADTGEGVRQDHVAALGFYRLAARLGDAPAMLNVAVCADSGIGMARDPALAASWYRQAAAHHVGRAEYDLALMLRSGDGVPRQPADAQRLFRAAAADGVSAALRWLPPGARSAAVPPASGDATFLAAQHALLSRSPGEAAAAVVLFRRAAAGDGPNAAMAQYDLAWCLETGSGVPADASQAYVMYLRAAARTDDPGLRHLAEAGAAGVRREAGDPSALPAIRLPAPETPDARLAGRSG